MIKNLLFTIAVFCQYDLNMCVIVQNDWQLHFKKLKPDVAY